MIKIYITETVLLSDRMERQKNFSQLIKIFHTHPSFNHGGVEKE